MDAKERFIKLWAKNFGEEELPDLEFFDGAEESLLDRARASSENLKQALNVLEREGLLFRYLCEILNISDLEDFKYELHTSLQVIFCDQEMGEGAKRLQSYVNENDNSKIQNQSYFINENKQVSDEEEGSFRDRGGSFAFVIESRKSHKVPPRDSMFGPADESGIVAGGSELRCASRSNHSHLSCNISHPETSASSDNAELFNKHNNKMESGPCESWNDGKQEGLANMSDSNSGNTETSVESSLQMNENNIDPSNGTAIKDSVHGDNLVANVERPHTTICTSFKDEMALNEENSMTEMSKGKYEHSPPTISQPLNTCDTAHSGINTTEETTSVTSSELGKPNVGNEVTSNTGGNDFQIENNSCVNITIDSCQQGMSKSENNAPIGKASLAEEETFDLAEEKEALDTPDVFLQGTGIVDDLISYLESVQLENSSGDEDEPLNESTEYIVPFGLRSSGNRKVGILRKKQLQSCLSASSIQSGDSCLSPWALDVAMAEIHSADSSDENDKSSSPKRGQRSVIKLSNESKESQESNSPPPRPPRRRSKKGMVRAHTVGTPKQLRPSVRTLSDDDEVFRKEELGYEGDQEGLPLNQLSSSAAEVRLRASSDALEDERRKLRRSRGSNVILDEDNVDFPSSPLSSPTSSPQRSADNLDDSAQKLHARKWVASAVMDSEKGYLLCLSTLHKYMKPFKASLSTSAPILTVADFNKIFYKIDELFTIHSKFYNDLEARVASWNPNKIIGDLFLSLVEQFDVYREYIMNYKTAIDTIHKCKSNEQFSQIFSKEIKLTAIQEVTTLEGLFSKPVDRIGRYVTVLNDLMKQTPQDHPDHSILTDVQVYTLQFISRISGGDQKDGPHFTRVKRDHHLIKDGFLVELTDGVRKFRHLFLFNDVLICTKRKISGRQEQYVSKWYLQLSDVQLHPHENSEAAQIVPVASQADFDLLKGRIVSLKAEIKQEQGMTGQSDNSPDASPSSKQKRAHSTINKMVEKLKKKLAQQEAALLLAIPSLPLHLYHRQGKTYTLLCKSDVERADWKEAMLPLLKQDNLPSGALSLFELQTLLEACKKLRTCKTIGKVSIKEDKELFNGVLYVHVQNGKGFHRSDLYCTLEVDHFGQFVKKARTKIAKTTGDPVWDQDFDLEVEGTKELRIHVYSKSRYTLQRDEECGLGRIQLRRESLADLKKRTITIALDKQGAITLSLQYSKTRQGIERKKSVNSVGVFGVDIETVTSRESCDIPLIVIGCVREIEKRGLEEVGIYRLSGASSDVKRLKEGFDENSQSALVLVSEADIHAVAGLFKMYLRDLPEPLFTDELYDKFVKAYAMADAEEKRETMLELFQSLPTPNRLTACYLFQHLRKVAEKSEVHKMGLNNLSTVFGPNVLRPSPKTSSPMDLAQGTLDVMSQVGIFMYFLKLDAEELHLPNDPELMRRLDPCHGSDVTTGEPEVNDRLI